MRTTTNNPNPWGDLICEFGVEPSDLVVCLLGVNDEAGGERDRKVGDPGRDGGRVLTGLTLRRPVLFEYLLKDGVLKGTSDLEVIDGVWSALTFGEDDEPRLITRAYRLTELGKGIVLRLRSNAEAF